MFTDPLGTITVGLPPAWAFDPRFSSLTHLAFIDWTAPLQRRIYVYAGAPWALVPAGKSDAEWEEAVRGQLPDVTSQVERRPGPVILAEIPAFKGRSPARVAWVRGPRIGVLIEQQGVDPGGALATQELNEALRTLQGPLNVRIPDGTPQSEWTGEMDAASAARRDGQIQDATDHLERAREAAKQAWLYSLLVQNHPDVNAALCEAESTLLNARLNGSLQHLHDATTTLYRCRGFLAATGRLGTEIDENITKLLEAALGLHEEISPGIRPSDCGQACLSRARMGLTQLARLQEQPPDASVSWVTSATLATLASENAATVTALAAISAAQQYSDLTENARAVFAQAGIRDEAAWRKGVQESYVAVLDTYAMAGLGVCSVELAQVSVSARAMRANAVAVARKVAELVPTAERKRILVKTISGYAGALAELRDQPSLDEGLRLLSEAAAILDGLGEEAQLRATLLTNKAALWAAQNRTEPGLQAADAAIALASAARVNRIEALARSSRARLLITAGRYAEALDEAGRAMEKAAGGPLAAFHIALASAHHCLGNRAVALEQVRAGLVEALARNPLSDAVEELLATAAKISESEDPATWEAAIEAADLVSEVRRSDVGDAAERIATDDAAFHRELASALVERRLKDSNLMGALAAADGHRARTLTEIADRRHDAREGVPYRLPPAGAPLARQIAFVAKTAGAVMERWGIPPPLDAGALTRIVTNHGRTIVLYHPVGNRLAAFVVRPGSPVAVQFAATPFDQILELTDALRRRFGIVVAARAARGEDLPPQSIEDVEKSLGRYTDQGDVADAELDAAGRKLHSALFSSVLPLLRAGEPLAIVPYRELSVIPLAVLTGTGGRALVEDHPLSVLPSLASLDFLTRPGEALPHAVVVGDPLLPDRLGLAPLPGAEQEARTIGKMLAEAGIAPTLLLEDCATEANFRKNAAGARIVHLACHAALREPASSSPLFLSPSAYDDGLLLPSEIADLQLDGALVALSACESGLGRATADGVLGLGRAFMQAGARTVLLSLWRVGDAATARLMTEFYAGLLGTASDRQGRRLDAAAAAQRAQLVTSREISRHPGTWGPWLVVGDGGWRIGA